MNRAYGHNLTKWPIIITAFYLLFFLFIPNLSYSANKIKAESKDKIKESLSKEAVKQQAKLNQLVYEAQKRLIKLGLNPGIADGILGPKTNNAIKGFQKNNKLVATGNLDKKTIEKLGIITINSKKLAVPLSKNNLKPKINTFKQIYLEWIQSQNFILYFAPFLILFLIIIIVVLVFSNFSLKKEATKLIKKDKSEMLDIAENKTYSENFYKPQHNYHEEKYKSMKTGVSSSPITSR